MVDGATYLLLFGQPAQSAPSVVIDASAWLLLFGNGPATSPPPPPPPPPPPTAIDPAGTWSRQYRTWSRTWSRTAWPRTCTRLYRTWNRVWRYSPVATAIGGGVLFAAVDDSRDYLFDFSRAPEIVGGLTINVAEMVGGDGLNMGSAIITSAIVDGVPAGQGVTVQIWGGVAGTNYGLACKVTLSNGRVLVVPGALNVVTDY